MSRFDELDLLDQAQIGAEQMADEMGFTNDVDRRSFVFMSLAAAAATTFGYGAKALAQGTNDTIRVVEKAAAPTKGKSLRKPVAILAFLFAGFSALCVGLLRVFLTPGLPTPASAARTFDLPVLATAGYKSARRA